MNKLVKWIGKLLGFKMVTLNLDKIKAKIDELNAETVALSKLLEKPRPLPILVDLQQQTDTWDEVAGLFWYTEVMPDNLTGGVKIMPSGLVIKAFFNKKTGELRTFPAKIFE